MDDVLKTYNLPGLTLTAVDKSRPVAGDRWLIEVEVGADIALPARSDNPDLALLQRAFGAQAPYRHAYKRNFVALEDKPGLIDWMLEQFEATVLPYLDRPDAASAILRSLAAEVRRNYWKYNLRPQDVA